MFVAGAVKTMEDAAGEVERGWQERRRAKEEGNGKEEEGGLLCSCDYTLTCSVCSSMNLLLHACTHVTACAIGSFFAGQQENEDLCNCAPSHGTLFSMLNHLFPSFFFHGVFAEEEEEAGVGI